MTCRKGSTKLPVESFSRPCTNSPDSYLNGDSASHNLEHFLSAGVRKRHNVLTILFTLSALLPTTTEQPQVCKCELMALRRKPS